MGYADHRRFSNARVAHRGIFQVDGTDPFTAGLDHILGAVGNAHIAIRIHAGDITGAKVAILIVGVDPFHPEVATAYPATPYPHLAGGLPVPGLHLALIVDDAHIHTEHRAPLFQLDGIEFIPGQVAHSRLQGVEYAQRTGLCHTPGVVGVDTVLFTELFHNGQGTGGTADDDPLEAVDPLASVAQVTQQREPHGGHTGGHGHFFLLDQALQGFAVAHLAAGHHQLGANHRGTVGNAPGIDVKHRHNGQDDIVGRHGHGIGQGGAIGVQDGGAMAVQHPLGITRCTGGVTECAGGILVQIRPAELPRLPGDKTLVVQGVLQGSLRHVLCIGQHHILLYGGQLLLQVFQQGQEEGVYKYQFVLCMIDNVVHLFREQARIDGVANSPGAGDRVVQFEVTVVVPGQGGDTIAFAYTGRRQRVGQLPGSAEGIGIGVAVPGIVGGDGDNLGISENLFGEGHNAGDSQRQVHHLAWQHR